MTKIVLTTLLCSFSLNLYAGSRLPKIYQVQVVKNFMVMQCQNPTAEEKLKDFEQELTQANIKIYKSRIEGDGRMYPQACGFGSGYRGIFNIPKNQFKNSQTLGFQQYEQP